MKTFNRMIIKIMILVPSCMFALTGKEIYQSSCAACHGEYGKGALPGITPDLTDKNGPFATSSDELHIKHIMEGLQRPGSQLSMPAKGGNGDLTVNDAKKVLQYMRKNFLNSR